MLLKALWAGTPVTEADKELRAYQTQPAIQHFDLLIACLQCMRFIQSFGPVTHRTPTIEAQI